MSSESFIMYHWKMLIDLFIMCHWTMSTQLFIMCPWTKSNDHRPIQICIFCMNFGGATI